MSFLSLIKSKCNNYEQFYCVFIDMYSVCFVKYISKRHYITIWGGGGGGGVAKVFLRCTRASPPTLRVTVSFSRLHSS